MLSAARGCNFVGRGGNHRGLAAGMQSPAKRQRLAATSVQHSSSIKVPGRIEQHQNSAFTARLLAIRR
eukprot:849004-Pelagomonas_calceolata.AAC.1